MNCCSECFQNTNLKAIVSSLGTPTIGVCDYCNSSGQNLVPVKALADDSYLLKSVVNLFIDADKVDPKYLREAPKMIHECLNEKWSCFSANVTSPIKLLTDMFDGNTDVDTTLLTKRVVTRCLNSPDVTGFENQWKEFVKEVMTKNRYFPEKVFDYGALKRIFTSYLKTIPVGTKLYRARVSGAPQGFPPNEMSKPPADKTQGGRANPAGISYLYVSKELDTPIYEARAGMVDYVTVAEFELEKEMVVVPLKDFESVDPFGAEDIDAFEEALVSERYLKMLEEELARPVRKQDSEINYVPTQYLCEFIKTQIVVRVDGGVQINVDGVEYASSMKQGGTNLALFNDAHLKCISTKVYRVTSIHLDYEELPPSGNNSN